MLSLRVLPPLTLLGQWLKNLPYKRMLSDIEVLLCHGSPVRLEDFEYIFAPEQARECLPILDELGV